MQMPMLILMLENPEWLIILAIVVVLFGGSRLGQLGASLGQGIRDFKHAMREDESTPAAPTRADASGGATPNNVTLISAVRDEPARLGDYTPSASRHGGD